MEFLAAESVMRIEWALIAGLAFLALSLVHEFGLPPTPLVTGQATQNEQEGGTAVDGEPIACTIRGESTCAGKRSQDFRGAAEPNEAASLPHRLPRWFGRGASISALRV